MGEPCSLDLAEIVLVIPLPFEVAKAVPPEAGRRVIRFAASLPLKVTLTGQPLSNTLFLWRL
jgi:hypothetical protein